jgi:hypothetical protein
MAMLLLFVSFAMLGRSLVWAQSNPKGMCANAGFDARPWLEDFDQLTAEMAAHYSDLEFAVNQRRMDLPRLRRETTAKLDQSCDENEARRVLGKFLDSFGDGHLEIDWPQASAPSVVPAPAAAAADSKAETPSLCARLGYRKRGFKGGIEFSQLPQFSSIGGEEADWFPGGILRLRDDAKLGVIRIALLSEHAFPEACEQTVPEMHLADSNKCDQRCENAVERETGNHLTAAIVRRSAQLQAAGASAILVDITHNGGGSDWMAAPPRALSRIPLRESRFAFIKHEHWTKQLKEQLADVETDLKRGTGPKDALEEAAARLRAGIVRSQEPCDRSRVWIDGKLPCSLLVSDVLFGGGIVPYAQPGSFASLESRTTLFHPLRYAYTESSARLPLYVVVDADTWSAAEYFAAILQDNRAATIVGEVTGGAGCGYTNDGIPTTLKNSHASVKMPDCVRVRKDGSNEVSGITPDVLVPWSAHDSTYLRAEKLFRSLLTAVAPEKNEARHEAH